MLDAIPNTQTFADMLLKQVQFMTDVPETAKRDAVRAISLLERAGWHRRAMTEALNTFSPETTITDSEIQFTGENPPGQIRAVIWRYLTNISFQAEGLQQVLTLQEAADYLNVSAQKLEAYIEPKRRIPAERVAGQWVLIAADLDQFRADRQARQRPPATT